MKYYNHILGRVDWYPAGAAAAVQPEYRYPTKDMTLVIHPFVLYPFRSLFDTVPYNKYWMTAAKIWVHDITCAGVSEGGGEGQFWSDQLLNPIQTRGQIMGMPTKLLMAPRDFGTSAVSACWHTHNFTSMLWVGRKNACRVLFKSCWPFFTIFNRDVWIEDKLNMYNVHT